MNEIINERPRILVADDEPLTLEMYSQILCPIKKPSEIPDQIDQLSFNLFGEKQAITASADYDTVFCRQGSDAIEAVKQSIKEGRPFSVAYLDIRMPPGPDGIVTAQQIRMLDPDIEIVMVTGHSDIHPKDINEKVPPIHKLLYVQKPFFPQEIYQFTSALTVKRQNAIELRNVHNQLKNDIECRKKIEEALRDSENRFRSIFNSVQAGILIIETKKFKIIDANLSAASIMGISKDKIIGKEANHVIYPNPADSFPTEGSDMKIENREAVLITPASEKIPILRTLTQISLDGMPHLMVSFIDIREMKKTETKRKNLEIQLRQTQRLEAIGTLAGGIAHDFNNILSSIMGNAEIALHHELEENHIARHSVEQIIKASHRAKNLIKQIIAFSRQKEQELQPFKITPIIKETLKLLRASLPAEIEIRQRIHAENDTVLCEPSQIQQVLMNLCTNAAYAMSKDGGILEVKLVDTVSLLDMDFKSELSGPIAKSKNYVKLSVSDTGEGMEPAVMEHIFEPYFTTKPMSEGTGLGLAVVHGIVKQLKGMVRVYSELGQGATFDLFLPFIETHESAIVDIDKKKSPCNERILLVDDEDVLVDMGKRMLEGLGYRVYATFDSHHALDIFRKDPKEFDLVITDMSMPGLTGDKLAIEMMRIRPDIPVILCTGYSEIITEDDAKHLGIGGFLMKPIVMNEISHMIRTLLSSTANE